MELDDSQYLIDVINWPRSIWSGDCIDEKNKFKNLKSNFIIDNYSYRI